MRRQTNCAFCDSEAKLTAEHVWSNWIVDLLQPVATGFNFSFLDTETGTSSRWNSPTMHQTAKVVCKRCNETWMSDIEGSARVTLSNIIRDGAPVSLLSRGVVSLARYAFKCAIIGNHMSFEDGRPFFSSHIRRTFRETLGIPDGVYMWLADFRGAHRVSGRYSSLYAKPPAGPFDHLDFYIFTFAAGRLALPLGGLNSIALELSSQMLSTLTKQAGAMLRSGSGPQMDFPLVGLLRNISATIPFMRSATAGEIMSIAL